MVKNLSTVERSTKIRFGKNCTDEQGENTIVFNASNEQIDTSRSGTVYMTPLRQVNTEQQSILTYDATTKEIINSGISTSQALGVPSLQEVTAVGNTTTSNIGIANTNPQHLLSVSNTFFVSNVGAYHLRVAGAAYADSLQIGSSILLSSAEAINQVQVSGQIKSDRVLIDSRLAVANTSPTKEFSLGNLLYMDRSVDRILQTTRDIEARTYYGSGSSLTGLSLDDIATRNSTTSASLNLTNTGTSLTTTGNVVVGNSLAVRNLSVGFVPVVTDSNVLTDSTIQVPSAGTLRVDADVSIHGNLVTYGNVTQISANNLTVDDPLILVGNHNPLDNNDLGVIMRRPTANVAMGFRGDESEFMIGYTHSDASGTTLTPLTTSDLDVKVYGNLSAKELSALTTESNVNADNVVASHIFGPLEGANTISASTVTALTTESNLVADNVVASHIFGPLEGANTISASTVTALTTESNLVADNVVASHIFGPLEGANTISASTVSALTMESNLVADNVVASHIFGPLEGANTISASTVSALTMESNLVADNVVASHIFGPLEGANTISASTVSALTMESNLVADNVVASHIFGPLEGANTISASIVTALTMESNLVADNVVASHIFGPLEGANTISASTVTALTTESNVIADNVVASHIFGPIEGANTISASTVTALTMESNVVADNVVASHIFGPLEGANTISASTVTALTMESNVVADNVVASHIFGPLEGANTISASTVTALTMESNLVADNVVASHIFGPLEGANTISASTVTALTTESNVIADNVVASHILGPIEGANTISASTMTALTTESNLVADNVVASHILGPIEGANTISASMVTALTTESNLVADNVVASHIFGPLEGANTISASTVTALTMESNIVADNVVASHIFGPLEGANTISASIVTALTMESNLVADNVVASHILGPIEGANTISASTVTALTTESNLVADNVVASHILGPIEGANTISASTVTALTMESNIVADNVVASHIFGPLEGANTISASTVTALTTESNVVADNVVASHIFGPLEGANTISASTVTALTTESNIVADNVVASHIFGPLEGANTISASVVTALTTESNVIADNVVASTVTALTTESNVIADNVVASHIYGPLEGANTISASVVTALTTESNVIADNVVASHIFGPIEGSNTISASVVTATNVNTQNVLANIITANIYFGDGGFLSNIAANLQEITVNGNVTDQVVQFTNPTTAFTTDLTSNILVNISQLNDVTLSTPSDDQVLMYDGVKWINQHPNHNFVAAKNSSETEPLTKGTVVYVKSQQNQNLFEVEAADASDPNKMPAIGVVYADIPGGGEGVVVAYGRAQNVDVDGFQPGEVLFVSNVTAGTLSNVKPLGPNDGIQNIGICTKTGTTGTVFVTGVGRTNDIPNAPVVTAQPGYVYVNTTGNELKKMETSNVLTKLQTLEQVVNTGNIVANTIQVTGLTTTGNVSVGSNIFVSGLTDAAKQYLPMVDHDGKFIKSPVYLDTAGRYIISASEAEFLGNITLGGNTTILSTSSLVVEDRIIGIGANNYASEYDTGIIIEHKDGPQGNYSNIAIIYHGDEHILRFGYTQNTWTDDHIQNYFNPAHPMIMDIQGNLLVQNNITVVNGSYFGDGTKLTGVALSTDLIDNVNRITNNENDISQLQISVQNIEADGGAVSLQLFESNVIRIVNLESNLNANSQRIGTLETDLTNNVTRIGTLETDLTDNVTRIGTLETDLTDNVTRIGTMETDLTDNVTRIGTLETDLTDNVTRIGTLETDLTDNVTRIGTLETDLTDNVTRIGTLETDLTDNVTRVGTLETDLTDNVTRIGTLETDLTDNVTRIGTLETDLTDNVTRIGTLETDLTDNVTRIGTLETDLTDNVTRIGTLETDLTDNVTRIGTLETDLSDNVTRIGTLETDLTDNVTRIGTLETDLSDNVTRIGTLETDLTDNVTRIINLESNLVANSERIDDLETYLGSNVTRIVNLESNLVANSERIDDLETYLGSNVIRIVNLESNLVANSERIDDLETYLGSNVTRIVNLESNLVANSERIDDLVTDLESNVIRIINLESNLVANSERIDDLVTDLGSNVTRIVNLESNLVANSERIDDLETYLGSNVTRIVNLESNLVANSERIDDLETYLGSNVIRIVNLESNLVANSERIDDLETYLGSNVTRIVNLESNLVANSERIDDLETYLGSNVTRIVNIESNLVANSERIDDLETYLGSNVIRITNLESNLVANSQRITTLENSMILKAPLLDPVFTNNVTVTGNLTVLGTTTTVNTENLLVKDPIITVSNAAAAVDAGMLINRQDNNVFAGFDTSAGEYTIGFTDSSGLAAVIDIKDNTNFVANVHGNVVAKYYFGDGSLLTGVATASNLDDIVNIGNATSNTMLLTNATTGLVATGDIESKNIRLNDPGITTTFSSGMLTIDAANKTYGTGSLITLTENMTDLSYTNLIEGSQIIIPITSSGGDYTVSNTFSNVNYHVYPDVATISAGNQGLMTITNLNGNVYMNMLPFQDLPTGSGGGGSTSTPSLQSVTDVGSVTNNTIQFTNPTTGLVVSSNLEANNFTAENIIKIQNNVDNGGLIDLSTGSGVLTNLPHESVLGSYYGYLNQLPGLSSENNGLTATGTITAASYVTSSDDRLKSEEKYINNAMDVILKLKPQTYMKSNRLDSQEIEIFDSGLVPTSFMKEKSSNVQQKVSQFESGLIAQEIYYNCPELRHVVNVPDDAIPKENVIISDDPTIDPDYGFWGNTAASVNYTQLIPYLISAVQELKAEINELKTGQ
jgi:predicted  nucleic acid-binding Zn-ribbon protein